tara:strand:+ start:669 stop:1754 length:1086 start_codon:yes stop_codon:yes gene_type:complete
MWSQTYQKKKLGLDIELTTNCNARCPQCSRTDQHNYLKRKEWLPIKQVSLKEFQNWFPKSEHLNSITNFHFSGTYGDPGMCKDLKYIVEYIISNTDTTTISINTNGSMRDEEFWFEIGVLGGKRLKIIFDVDGIDQEMHSFYRRGTNLKKILSNIETACQTMANIAVLTVVFQHNEDYVEEIQDMCRKLGVTEFDVVEGNNFEHGPTYSFIDEKGNQQELKQITRKDREQGLDRLNRIVRDHRHNLHETHKYIECAAAKEMSLQISSNGLVTPCCFLSQPLEQMTTYRPYLNHNTNITTNGKDELNNVMKKFINRNNDFNLNHKNIDEIVNDIWYTKELSSSFHSKDTSSFACKKVCGKCL